MNTFLFITALVVSVVISVVFLTEIKDLSTDKKPSKTVVNIRCIARGMSVFMASVGITDIFGFIDFGMYCHTYAFMGLICIICYVLCEIHSRSRHDIIPFIVKTILIAFVLEMTVFNIPSYRLWFDDYPTITYEATRQIMNKGGVYRRSDNDIAVMDGNEVVLSFPNINRKVSTVYADVVFSAYTRSADLWIDAKDETQSHAFREDIAHTIISRKQAGSQYVQCELSGKTSDLIVKIRPVNYGTVYIKSITINMPVAFDISLIRFFLIVLLSVFIHAFLKERLFQKSVASNYRFCRIFTVLLTVSACAWAVLVTDYRLDDRTWKDEFKKKSGNQLTQQLVDAFIDGRTYLVEEPDELLLNFDNPYDRQHREAELDYKWTASYSNNSVWDHVYYNGKFYSYYGIAPVFLLFLPYHLITGYYFPDNFAVLIFALIGIIGLSVLFMKFVRKFFPNIPTGLFMISLIIIQMTSGIWYSIGRPLFYEIAMSAGFAFMTWAFCFLVSSNVIGGGKISLPKTALSSLFFALAVLSRPTIVLYCLCTAVFMICAVPRFSHGKQKMLNKKSIKFLACAFIPMATLGIVQMIYNYVRFDSPFEFGIQYSLTINDFRNTEFHTNLSLIPFYNYLFNVPVFSTSYPFVSANFQGMNVNGFFYNDYESTHNVCGLFFLALPLFFWFLSGKALKTIPDRRTKIKNSLYLAFPCLIIPIIIICSVWESGYSIRYMTDFAWQMLTGALAVIFFIYVKTQNPTVRKIINIFFCFSLVWTIFVSGIQTLNQTFRYCWGHYDYPEIAYEIEKLLVFWK
ncbi:MAG: hypothetical protein K2J08_07390 [Ruminococcus sp.]|nr:hypothetical protein [Ruminococcus sp.]